MVSDLIKRGILNDHEEETIIILISLDLSFQLNIYLIKIKLNCFYTLSHLFIPSLQIFHYLITVFKI